MPRFVLLIIQYWDGDAEQCASSGPLAAFPSPWPNRAARGALCHLPQRHWLTSRILLAQIQAFRAHTTTDISSNNDNGVEDEVVG